MPVNSTTRIRMIGMRIAGVANSRSTSRRLSVNFAVTRGKPAFHATSQQPSSSRTAVRMPGPIPAVNTEATEAPEAEANRIIGIEGGRITPSEEAEALTAVA
jgi:hypothetical protein